MMGCLDAFVVGRGDTPALRTPSWERSADGRCEIKRLELG